jgi:hypothetical protein
MNVNLRNIGILEHCKSEGLVKGQKTPFSVIPVKTGIQGIQEVLDSRLRGSDGFGDFLRSRQIWEKVFVQHSPIILVPQFTAQVSSFLCSLKIYCHGRHKNL